MIWFNYFFIFRCHKLEHITLCVKYVKELNVFERFLRFAEVSEKQDSQTLAETILNFKF